MSLRKEIYKLMLRARSYDEVEGQDSEYFTNEIISMIEKRIDEKIEWFKSEYDGTVDPYIIIPYLQEIKELLK